MSFANSVVAARPGGTTPSEAEDRARLDAMARDSFQFVWRSLRRLGVPAPAVDDAAQKVFEVATRKLANIRVGAERAFLFNTAVRVASGMRRRDISRRETSDDALEHHEDPAPHPDEAADGKRRREALDLVLDSMPMDLRSVFVLFELEGMSTHEIAVFVGIPAGTAASRLRRAREHFQAHVKRLRAKQEFSEGQP